MGKSQSRDPLVISEAASRPSLHWVPIKSTAQQVLHLLHGISCAKSNMPRSAFEFLRHILEELDYLAAEVQDLDLQRLQRDARAKRAVW